MKVSLEKLKSLVERLKHRAIEPEVVQTKDQADRMNIMEDEFFRAGYTSRKHHWSVGDKYFTFFPGEGQS